LIYMADGLICGYFIFISFRGMKIQVLKPVMPFIRH
jgi:hypothetical protein